MNADQWITGGGLTALAIAIGAIGKLWLTRHSDRTASTGVITDAAQATAILSQTLEALQSENVRQAKKIQHLEQENREKDEKIRDLEVRVNCIARELTALRRSGTTATG